MLENSGQSSWDESQSHLSPKSKKPGVDLDGRRDPRSKAGRGRVLAQRLNLGTVGSSVQLTTQRAGTQVETCVNQVTSPFAVVMAEGPGSPVAWLCACGLPQAAEPRAKGAHARGCCGGPATPRSFLSAKSQSG